MSASARRLDRRIVLGLALTATWLALGAGYIAQGIGWRAFLALPPSELASFLEGAVAPLAFLWLVLGLFMQQSELQQNSRALALQSEALQKSAEQAEIQARAIHANELHARQDTFVDLYALVTRQLGVMAALLYMSSQQQSLGGSVPQERVSEMWTQLGAGDSEVFMRGMLALGATLPAAEGYPLFFGTPVRTRHTEAFIGTFERLLRNAEACDPDGLIKDAILGNGSGRLFSLIMRLRDNPPDGAVYVPAS
ncbi:MAG: hypothetical protein FJ091_02070 [Deltaproteobacteria bacterium]|nr:hypothetical protein [Deltaproteobacteria bacterium]